MSEAIEAAIELAVLAALQGLGRATPRELEEDPAVSEACEACPLRMRDILDRMRRAGKIGHDHSRYPPRYWCWPPSG